MNELKFWDNWLTPNRRIYLSLLTVFTILLVYYCYAVFMGESNALEWRITSSLDTIEVPINTVSVGLFDLELTAENYLINQHYQGSAHQITPLSGHIYLLIFCVGLTVLLTTITYLKRFWFLFGMTIACFIFVNFRFEQLEINGWIDNTFLIIVLVLFLPVSYYFQSIRNDRSLLTRLVTFGGLFLLIAVIIKLFSHSQNPFYFLANYNYTAPVVISILFIFLVAHEIIFLILYLTSSSIGPGTKNNLTHFIALSLIYLVNVGLVYLKNASVISWDLIYVNATLLLVMSSIIGLWGFKQRDVLYGNIIRFNPYGGLFFLAMGIICFSTIGYHTVTANDPVLETFEDAIVFSHIGFGIMFVLYILSNFINLLKQNLPVYRIAFKEDNMPNFSANIAGLVVVAAFYYLSDQAAFLQAFSGYYNGLGSVYYHEKDLFLAEEYYKRGAVYGYNNHRSNYSIGELAYQKADYDRAIARFKNATLKNPTEFAFINLANAQKEKYMFFDALFTLRNGIKAFPNSGKIKNNLGLMFKNTNVLDSAIYYMESGADDSWGNKTNTTNIIDVLARNSVHLPTDSLTGLFKDSDHLPLLGNLLAYSNKTGYWLQESLDVEKLDSALNLHQFAYLYNLGFSFIKNPPEEFIETLGSYAQQGYNANFREQLSYLGALLQYYHGDVNSAFRTLDLLQNNAPKKGYYNHVMGVMCMEQESPKRALDFFQIAAEEGYPGAKANLAIALMESGEKSQSIGLWNELLEEDSIMVANDVLVALTAPFSTALNSDSDALKYQFARYRIDISEKAVFDLIVESIKDDSFRFGALSAFCAKLTYAGLYSEAEEIIRKLRSFEVTKADIILNLESDLKLAQIADGLLPMEAIGENDPIAQNWSQWKQNQPPEARVIFKDLGMNNPFDESRVILASKFFNKEAKDVDQAYEILLNAIEINPYSIRLLKAYILQAIRVGQPNYARIELLKLYDLMPETEYREFESLVEKEIASFENFPF